jgi:2,3-bisphosphoglycerate-independent phosphoglycerate mutase
VGTDFAHFLMMGYREEHYPGRSVVDGLAHNIPLEKDRLYMVTSWASVVKEDSYRIRSRYLMDISKEDSVELGGSLPKSIDGFNLQWHYTTHGHGLLEIMGQGLTTMISDPDGIYPLGYVLQSEPYDTDGPKAKRVAEAVNQLMKTMHPVLENHPVNKRRKQQGLEPANFLLPKWAGMPRELPSFHKENGMKGEIIGASDMIRGIARLLQMEYTHYDTYESGVNRAMASTAEFVHLHTKETDQAAHTKDPLQKVRALEEIDPLLQPLVEYALKEEVLLFLAGDHTTPSTGKMIHSGEPVPVAFLGKNVRPDGVKRYDERACAQGSIRMKGEDLMAMVLNYQDKSLFHHFRVGGRKSKYLPRRLNKL